MIKDTQFAFTIATDFYPGFKLTLLGTGHLGNNLKGGCK